MSTDLSWLETWHGEVDINEMMDSGRWEAHRASVRHPTSIFSLADEENRNETQGGSS